MRYARAKVKMGIASIGGHVPDEFQVLDELGQEIARHHIKDQARK